VEAGAPDEFLVDLDWLSPPRVDGTPSEQAQGYASPPVRFEGVGCRDVTLASFANYDPPDSG